MIKTVDWNFLEYFPKVEFLDLSYNNLTTSVGMRHISSKAKNLKSLKLEGNPFHCSCIEITELNDIAENNLLVKHQFAQFHDASHSVTCVSPENVAGLKVDDFFSAYCETPIIINE